MTPATAARMAWLLNIAHALDHLVLLVFATAVGTMAPEFGFARWEDLMPYGAGAFVMFGLGSAPAGRLGDLWGRRRMMLLFFFGIAGAALLAAAARSAWQLAVALTLLGSFASIYHPVGIPMLLRHAAQPGRTIGISGLSGNLGIASAALLTGLLVQVAGWRAAFVLPALACIACGLVFMRIAPPEAEPPARRAQGDGPVMPPALLARVLAVMTVAAITTSVLFNFLTNANAQLLAERLRGLADEPSTLGALLASVYAIAALAQVVVGRAIDRVALKPLYLGIVLAQPPLLLLAAFAQGWWNYAALLAVMALVFGAIPFTDAMIVRFVDDRMRSRVAGMRLTVSIGFSSLAVWLLGPLVKAHGFTTMLVVLAGIALLGGLAVLGLPTQPSRVPSQPGLR